MTIKSNKNGGKKSKDNDLGFGTNMTTNSQRFLRKDGSFNVIRRGSSDYSVYQQLLEMSWWKFVGLTVFNFILINCFFALLFVLNGKEYIAGVEHGSFGDHFMQAFFLSVQTFTSVGYGALSPVGLNANLISSVAALVGLISFAIATGLFFARFSKPKARILFSDQAIITSYREEEMSLQFRIANLRNNKLLDVTATVNVSWLENKNGKIRRRFTELTLERNHLFFFPLNWTIVHPINPKSPFYKKTPQDIHEMKTEILVLIQGYDETYAQTIHSNESYIANEIVFGVQFVKMYYPSNELHSTVLELDKISTVESIPKS
ncbi:MAG: ion channel [Saprospiraceae bacterium]